MLHRLSSLILLLNRKRSINMNIYSDCCKREEILMDNDMGYCVLGKGHR